MEKRLVPILDYGVLDKGYYRGKSYFLSQLIEGGTFSHFIQNSSINYTDLRKAFNFLSDVIIKFCRDHKFDPAYNQSSGSFIKSCVKESILKFNELRDIKILLDLEIITINQNKMVNLKKVVNEIFDHPSIKRLDEFDSFVSDIGHWNFHGDNILINNLTETKNFSIIDPDINLDTCDPLFTLARFIYTYQHDTADYGQYLIQSDFLEPSSMGNNYFIVKTMWPEVIFNAYTKLFCSIFSPYKSEKNDFINRLDDENELLRFELNYLLCLLRGINANYNDTFTMPSNKLNFFQNNGIFLYIQTVLFANELKDRLYEN